MITSSIFDIALYILKSQGEITAMKLQKLTFYVKAWGLVWDEEEIFPEEFQAWANGAVSRDLYNKHRGLFKVNEKLFSDANPSKILDNHRETIDAVLKFYGVYTAQQLSDINHQEPPWQEARDGCPVYARCENVITSASMAEYYSGIWYDTKKEQERT
ncbi:DUF4065 domain-containing protein [Desulfococcaceae bacterium HSG9]|nr:DUF4065 domain-containing protein [Desulfococcaceae bacterium HSG9]